MLQLRFVSTEPIDLRRDWLALQVKGVAKEMESTSAKAGKTISDFTCEMECTRRKSLQLQEELEKDIASILESERRKLYATPEEPSCSTAAKFDSELEVVKDELRQLAYRVDGLADGHVQRVPRDPSHGGAPGSSKINNTDQSV